MVWIDMPFDSPHDQRRDHKPSLSSLILHLAGALFGDFDDRSQNFLNDPLPLIFVSREQLNASAAIPMVKYELTLRRQLSASIRNPLTTDELPSLDLAGRPRRGFADESLTNSGATER